MLAIAGTACAAQPGKVAAPAISTPVCPARLATDQTAAAVAGWDQYQPPDGGRLDSVGFYEGPVAERAELAPDHERKQGRITLSTWTFEGHVKPIFFACRYGGTRIVLSRQLPASVRQCELREDAMLPAAKDAIITCR